MVQLRYLFPPIAIELCRQAIRSGRVREQRLILILGQTCFRLQIIFRWIQGDFLEQLIYLLSAKPARASC